jgi:hypothetical protein
MHGKMLWFNEVRDDGLILTEEDERLPALGSGFAQGVRPGRRCAQSPVVFEVRESAGERRAENIAFVEAASPRRARRRNRPVRGTQ